MISHGYGYLGIVDGCPPGLALEESDLQHDLDRRKPGQSRHTTQRREDDTVKIVAGVFEGRTTGTPIGLIIENADQKSKDYSKIKDKFRPGHADYTYIQKYGRTRLPGRRSCFGKGKRVCVLPPRGIAKKYLAERSGVRVRGYLAQLGEIEIGFESWDGVDQNPFFCAVPARVRELEAYMDDLRKSGDSIGARVNVIASGIAPGLGEPIFDRLDADIAKAMMGINAVKGVEIGDGFSVVTPKRHAASRRTHPGGFCGEFGRRRSWRNQQRTGYRCQHRAEADIQHPHLGRYGRYTRQAHRNRYARPS